MPTLKSQLKEVLDKKLKDASECILQFPNERSAQRYLASVYEIIAVCEKRKRY